MFIYFLLLFITVGRPQQGRPPARDPVRFFYYIIFIFSILLLYYTWPRPTRPSAGPRSGASILIVLQHIVVVVVVVVVVIIALLLLLLHIKAAGQASCCSWQGAGAASRVRTAE